MNFRPWRESLVPVRGLEPESRGAGEKRSRRLESRPPDERFSRERRKVFLQPRFQGGTPPSSVFVFSLPGLTRASALALFRPPRPLPAAPPGGGGARTSGLLFYIFFSLSAAAADGNVVGCELTVVVVTVRQRRKRTRNEGASRGGPCRMLGKGRAPSRRYAVARRESAAAFFFLGRGRWLVRAREKTRIGYYFPSGTTNDIRTRYASTFRVRGFLPRANRPACPYSRGHHRHGRAQIRALLLGCQPLLFSLPPSKHPLIIIIIIYYQIAIESWSACS
jgi:hypothetical protein